MGWQVQGNGKNYLNLDTIHLNIFDKKLLDILQENSIPFEYF